MERQPIAIIVTDTHLRSRNIPDNHHIYDQVIAVARQYGISRIFHGGDVFHSRRQQSLEIMVAWMDVLNKFNQEGLQIVTIPGNHDKPNYLSEKSFLDPYEHWPSFDLVKRHGIRGLSQDVEIHLVPFFDESCGLYQQYIGETIKKGTDRKKVLLTHIAVNGAKNNDGSIVDDKISHAFFQQFDLVLIGHYHNRQRLSDKIHYIGSTLPHDFGDNNDKGIVILYNDLTFDYHETQFKKYLTHKIEIKEGDSVNDVKKRIESVASNVDHVRVDIQGNRDTLVAYKEVFQQSGSVKIKMTYQDAIQVDENTIREIAEGQSDFIVSKENVSTLFHHFCDRNDVPNKDRESLGRRINEYFKTQ